MPFKVKTATMDVKTVTMDVKTTSVFDKTASVFDETATEFTLFYKQRNKQTKTKFKCENY